MTAFTLQQTADEQCEPASIWPLALLGALLLGVFIFFYLLATGYFFVVQAAGQKPGQTAPVKPRRAISKIATASSPATGATTAPAFSLKNLAGKEVALSAYQGRVVVLNFWATWCGPCQLETPWLVELRQKYQARGVEIIGISVDALDADYDAQDIRAFIKEHKVKYPIALATKEVVEAYGPISGIPATIVIDRAGQIHARHRGLITFDKLESEIKGLL